MHNDFNENLYRDEDGNVWTVVGGERCRNYCHDGLIKVCGHNELCEECEPARCPCEGTDLYTRRATEAEMAAVVAWDVYGEAA